MTPVEKAKELLWKYLPILEGWKYEDSELSKQCALIAVDEMLNELDHIPFHDDDYAQWKMKYWKQVKTEIEKL